MIGGVRRPHYYRQNIPFYSNHDMPVELRAEQKSTGGSFSAVRFGDTVSWTEIAGSFSQL